MKRFLLPGIRGKFVALGAFFGTKLAIGAAIVLGSARALGPDDFAAFSQFFLLAGYLMLLAAGGAVNGVIQRVAAARGDGAQEASTLRAALVLWGVAAALILMVAWLFAAQMSRMLVGDARFVTAIPVLAILATVGGLGQIFAAALTGMGRISRSLAIQTAGLLVGGIAAIGLLFAGLPIAAVLAFAAGPLLTTALAAWQTGHLLMQLPRAPWRADLGYLLSHSAAFTAVAAIPPAVLFGVRASYQGAFGLQMLGYWLAANRISDISSQLMGLYLAQVYLPVASGQGLDADARRRVSMTMLWGMALFAVPLVLFLLAPAAWVTAFFGSAFVPAIPFIIGYMVGDVLRVATSVTMMTALSQGRTRLYAAVELTATAIFAATATLLIGRTTGAPWIGYVAGHLTVCVGVAIWLLTRRGRR